MTPYGNVPPKCVCGHPKRWHAQPVWTGISCGMESACGAPHCYCLAYVAAKPKAVPG